MDKKYGWPVGKDEKLDPFTLLLLLCNMTTIRFQTKPSLLPVPSQALLDIYIYKMVDSSNALP